MKTKTIIPFLLITIFLMWSCEGTTEPDTEPPTAPTGLAFDANQSGDGEIYLLWNSNSENDLAGYNVYRAEGASSATYIMIATVLTNNFLDAGLDYSIDYFYKISAFDEDANTGDFSPIVGPIAPLNLNPPATPSSLVIAAHNLLGAADIELSWVGNGETDFLQYKVYRSDATALFPLDDAHLLDSTTGIFYLDYDVVAGTTYHYKLVAEDKGGLLSVSTLVLSDTPLEEPILTSPINPAVAIPSLVPEFEWTNVHGAHHYRIILRTDLQSGDIWYGEKVAGADPSLTLVYDGDTLASNTRYYWLLEGYSQDSEVVNVYSTTASFRTP